MSELNMYKLYSKICIQNNDAQREYKDNERERIANAFYCFHKPSNREEMEKFVNDALQGRNYNQTLEYDGETMDFEFTDESVRVTLHSDNPRRDNKYFAYKR